MSILLFYQLHIKALSLDKSCGCVDYCMLSMQPFGKAPDVEAN